MRSPAKPFEKGNNPTHLVQLPVHDRPVTTTQNMIIGAMNGFASLTGVNFTRAYLSAKSEEFFPRINDTREGFVRLTDENLEEEVVMERFWGGDQLSLIHI